MTELQYQRWKNFALRMAHRGLGLRSKRSRRFVAGCVKDFFRTLDREYLTVNETLPVVIDRFGIDENGGLHRYEFLRDRIESWDHTEPHPTFKDHHGHSTIGPYICDIVSGMEEHWNPYYWADDYRSHRWDERWGSRIRCCIRAGMDMAVAPSAGVLGFTAGDIRRMYRGRVPEWIFGNEPLVIQEWKGVVPGIGLVPGESRLNGTFNELEDSARVWL